MAAPETSVTDRRERIAESGLRILAREGVRALTHRAVDREAGLSQGSSSYYVPTRRALIELIVQTLAERSISDADRVAGAMGAVGEGASERSVDGLAAAVASLIEVYVSRPDEMRARYALLLELDDEDPLRAVLAERSPVQRKMTALVVDVLEDLGVAGAEEHARELFGLTDALLAHRVITGGDTPSAEAVISAYLRGIGAKGDGSESV